MDQPKFKVGNIINYIIYHANSGPTSVEVRITGYIDDAAPRYEYEYLQYPGVKFIALKSQIEDNSQTGGRKTRRNKLRKKRRKTNRRR